MAATQKSTFWPSFPIRSFGQFLAKMHRFATVQNVTDIQTTDRRHSVRKAWPIVRSANNRLEWSSTYVSRPMGDHEISVSPTLLVYDMIILIHQQVQVEEWTTYRTSPPQSNLRRARRFSADKTSSKLLGSHSPSMLSPFKTSLAEWSPISRMCCTYALYALSTVHLLLNGRRQWQWQWPCCVCFVTFFAHGFLFNPHFDLESEYIIRKPIIHSILCYIPHREILSTFHTRVDNRSIRHFTTKI